MTEDRQRAAGPPQAAEAAATGVAMPHQPAKVVLVAPPNPSMVEPQIAPPLGLLYLVGYARQQGEVTADWTVVDLNTECLGDWPARGHWTHDFSIERCMSLIPRGAQVYGIQLASMQIAHGRAIARELRRREPQALLVCGGSHASALPDECADPAAMQGGHFDVVVEREGERPFFELVQRAGEVLFQVRHGVWGVPGAEAAGLGIQGVRQASGGIGWVVRGAPIDPLNDLPFPARDKLDWSRYTRKIAGRPATNIITTRGCPARCVFCQQASLWGEGALRMQNAERILAEVDHIYKTTGIRHLLFLDDSLTARPTQDMRALCAGLKERGVLWRGWTRANLLTRSERDRETLQLMADAGCQAICVGVEAGTDKVLKAMDKGTTVAQNREALRRIHEAGIRARCSIMVGNPRETWEDVLALVRFVEEMRDVVDDWILSSYVPLPGTPSWDEPGDYGFIIDKGKAVSEGYRHFFVVGGDEQSGMVHRYADGRGPDDIQRRHDFVQEALLRLAPRDRIAVTIGRNTGPAAAQGASA